ncbi:hypothetical protein A3A74_06600 [Candidatus Roizmanbacteria bacterium RIFCSPLOWO2_01_FULL_35_13]|uniref:Uncharacterized protein n=1 Tax=Candidatus Roizmanbacteria bacterium RIFCSPLOWO2_01_FULL_35_13 TaxID=1802055 RepID=A0A1F7I870_9BACT|nr:MAG: hypothetical protein A3A74_06600 [Candidatus Roizmanbacteria bacterium RIFCSPLOWO2_01_FULL_35_13]
MLPEINNPIEQLRKRIRERRRSVNLVEYTENQTNLNQARFDLIRGLSTITDRKISDMFFIDFSFYKIENASQGAITYGLDISPRFDQSNSDFTGNLAVLIDLLKSKKSNYLVMLKKSAR